MNLMHTAVAGQEPDGLANPRHLSPDQRSLEGHDQANTGILAMEISVLKKVAGSCQMNGSNASIIPRYPGEMDNRASQWPVPQNVARKDVQAPGKQIEFLAAGRLSGDGSQAEVCPLLSSCGRPDPFAAFAFGPRITALIFQDAVRR